jgi:hypothetical protein
MHVPTYHINTFDLNIITNNNMDPRKYDDNDKKQWNERQRKSSAPICRTEITGQEIEEQRRAIAMLYAVDGVLAQVDYAFERIEDPTLSVDDPINHEYCWLKFFVHGGFRGVPTEVFAEKIPVPKKVQEMVKNNLSGRALQQKKVNIREVNITNNEPVSVTPPPVSTPLSVPSVNTPLPIIEDLPIIIPTVTTPTVAPPIFISKPRRQRT